MSKKKKLEFSQKICLFLIIFGVLGIAASYVLAFMGYEPNSTVTVALITEIMAASLGYLVYQFGLKNSRNKYTVDEDGIPYNWKEKIEPYDEDIDPYGNTSYDFTQVGDSGESPIDNKDGGI